LDEHKREGQAELKSTREEIFTEISKHLLANNAKKGVKLNLLFLGRLMSSAAAVQELMLLLKTYFQENLDVGCRDVICSYIDEILPSRIIVLDKRAPRIVCFSSQFNYSAWNERAFEAASELILSSPINYVAIAAEHFFSDLQDFNKESPEELQSIYDRNKSKDFLRTIKCAV
jgi:hypothetical protein